MRGKQCPAAVFFMQMFNDCPSYRQTVKSRRTAANFIKNDKRAFIRLIQNAGGFDHLNHKGRTAARQIVRSADTGKNLVDNADMRAFAGNKGAHLRHNGNDGVLPQESRLTGHVRTGQQPNQRTVVAQAAVVADKSAGMVTLYRLFDNRMAPVCHVKDQRIVQNRTAVVFFDGQIGQSRADVKLRQRLGRARNVIGSNRDVLNQIVEYFNFHRQRLVGRTADFIFQIGQFDRGKTRSVQNRLTVNELFVFQHFGGKLALHFDKIADNVVVFDFKVRNTGAFGIFVLQFHNQLMAVVLYLLNLVQRRIIALSDKTAVTRQQRQFFLQRTVQSRNQMVVIAEPVGDGLQSFRKFFQQSFRSGRRKQIFDFRNSRPRRLDIGRANPDGC